MRHIHGYYDRPFTSYYGNPYANRLKPEMNKTYIKIIDYIDSHPKCSRAEILANGLHRYETVEKAKKYGRGQWSSMFSWLLYRDIIDYDKHYRYTVTPSGAALLKEAYLNSMAKFVMNKA